MCYYIEKLNIFTDGCGSSRYDKEMASYVPPAAMYRNPKKDPNAPKRAQTAFQFYRKHLVDTDEKIKALPFGQQSKEVAKRWAELSDEEKEEFMELQVTDKERCGSAHRSFL